MLNDGSNVLLNISTIEIPIVILFSLVLAFGIAWIYKKTHHGLSYSQSFVFTIVLISILAAVTMMVIGSNLARAFTLLGAFTIIRFRTAVKDTKDTAFIFWSLITGMAVGVGDYVLATFETVIIGVLILLMSRYRFGSLRNYEHMLNFMVTAEAADNEKHKSLLKKYFSSFTLLNVTGRESGKKLEFTYNVKFIDDTKADAFMKEIATMSEVSNPNLFIAKDDVEY